MDLPGKPISLWRDATDPLGLPPLTDDVEADVCVIGAGIAGITAALELHRAGRSVVVLDMHEVGRGVTGNTTAKLQALQGTVYSQLAKRFGSQGAAGYAEMSQRAIDAVELTVGELGIECGFRRKPGAVYAVDAKDATSVEQEAEAARAAGLAVRLETDTELPYEIANAVVLDGQAEFDATAYVVGIARHLRDAGVRIFEQTTATHVGEGSSPEVRTEGGAKVRARDVVVTTHYPFLDRGLWFSRLTPKRSYCLAVRIPGPVPQGMYISAGQPTRSLRAHPDPERPGEELLIVGGEGHNAGEQGDTTDERYLALWDFAREHFGATEATHRWSAHDMQSADGLPYVGRLTPLSRHVWIASGFRKWGMTNGTAAGSILAARICGEEHPHAKLVDTQRFTPLRSAPGMAKEGLKDALHFVGDRLRSTDGSVEELPPGGGAILEIEGTTVAAARDEDGTLHALSPVCTHLGCRVAWNTAERSWDCPCHGSRFAVDGTVLTGPAVRPLPPAELGEEAPAPAGSASDD